jgi:putative Mg2+ transporter-C (MgtC) family protein
LAHEKRFTTDVYYDIQKVAGIKQIDIQSLS